MSSFSDHAEPTAVESTLSEVIRKQTIADIESSLAQGRTIISTPVLNVFSPNLEPAMLADAKSAIDEWCAAKAAALAKGHGFNVRSGLVQQVQREVMAEAHRLSGINNLSESEEAELVIHGVSKVEVPEFKVR